MRAHTGTVRACAAAVALRRCADRDLVDARTTDRLGGSGGQAQPGGRRRRFRACDYCSHRAKHPAAGSGAGRCPAVRDKPLPPPGAILTWPDVINKLTASNLLGSVEGWWLWAPCASWRTSSSDLYTGAWNASTSNPILVIGNSYDPRTAFANSIRAASRLGNAVLLTLNGYGHTSDVDPALASTPPSPATSSRWQRRRAAPSASRTMLRSIPTSASLFLRTSSLLSDGAPEPARCFLNLKSCLLRIAMSRWVLAAGER